MSDKNVSARKYNNYSTPQQVANDSFTSTLNVLCKKNNLFGLYVRESNKNDPDLDEMYFICGLDENTVRKAYKNVVEEYKDQKSKPDKFKFLHVTKLTDHSPVSSYIDVVSYCLHASTIRGICNKYGFNKQFGEISSGFATILEVAYLDTLKPGLSTFERRKRDNIVKELLESQGEREFLKKEAETPEFESAKLNPNITNMISFNKLICKNKELTRATTGSQKETDKMVDFFKNNPHIPFYQTKPLISKLAVSEDRMFGSKEDNTFYSCVFIYPTSYSQKIDYAYLSISANSYVKFSPPNISQPEIETCSFGISAHDINNIFELADKKGIPLWIDSENLYYSCNPNECLSKIRAGYRINGLLSMQKDIGLLLNEYAVGLSTERILSYDDFNRYNKNNPNVITYEAYQKNIGR